MNENLSILFEPLSKFINIRNDTIKKLNKLDIIYVINLLFHKPNYYTYKKIFPKEIHEGDNVILCLKILSINKGRRRTEIIGVNESYSVNLVFFNEMPYFLSNILRTNKVFIVEGKIQISDHQFQIAHPDFIFKEEEVRRIEPVYPLTAGVVNKQIYSYILKVLHEINSKIGEIPSICKDDPIPLLEAINQIHKPDNANNLSPYVRRLSKEELYINQIAMRIIKSKYRKKRSDMFDKAKKIQTQIMKTVGFQLTKDQKWALSEIERDQISEFCMNRMMQGDVGSGKTIVALLSSANVIQKKCQVALMAPTELLANQHFEYFTNALRDVFVKVTLLTGKTKKKSGILKELSNGEIDIIIGTHSLFQEKIIFHNLKYVIIDEQHRFGVNQRLALVNKSDNVDLLVMSATPIPRSLSLTIYGDMEISKLVSKPPGRKKIITTLMKSDKIGHITQALEVRVKNNEQIYWVCPAIEESQELINALDRYEVISEFYPHITGLIHGGMKQDQRDKVMSEFKKGTIKILVATTIVEVGVDVPQATVMIIENAEHFGLAQLHQLRGRVGRSDLESYCILIYYSSSLSQTALQRLRAIRDSNDGFYIAEQDLILRGEGDLVGQKQSGDQEFIFASLSKDQDLLEEAYNYSLSMTKEEMDNVPEELFKMFNVNKVFYV